MSNTKLTKPQKEMLQEMKDNDLTISNWIHNASYTLSRGGEKKDKSIRSDWMRELAPFFIQTYDSSWNTYRYKFRPDAEISDEWRAAEIARQAEEKANANAAKEAETARQNKIASDYFNDGNDGAFTVEMGGQWPFNGSILFNGRAIASITPAYYSTSDNTFADVLKRKDNIPHFDAIKALVRAANKAK